MTLKDVKVEFKITIGILTYFAILRLLVVRSYHAI